MDLGAGIAPLEEEYLTAIRSVIRSTEFTGGSAVIAFENAFATHADAKHAIAVVNGTESVVLALHALGIKPGDEVITAANSFFATAEAISHVGATPVLADVHDDMLLLNVDDAARRVTARTRAIIPVHLFGQMADMDAVWSLAKQHDLRVVEDAAQAHGATRQGADRLWRAGNSGQMASFSFYPAKNLGAFGDGGALTTNDAELATTVRQLRDHGQAGKHDHQLIGYNARLSSIACAALSISLRRLDAGNAARRVRAARYQELLAGMAGVQLVTEAPGSTGVYHLMVARVDRARRDEIRAQMAADGVATAIHYPRPIHLQGAYKGLRQGPGSCPVAECAAGEMISLPMYPELPMEHVDVVVDSLRRACSG